MTLNFEVPCHCRCFSAGSFLFKRIPLGSNWSHKIITFLYLSFISPVFSNILLTTGLQVTYTNKLKRPRTRSHRADRHLKVVITHYVSLENIFTATSASGFVTVTSHCCGSFSYTLSRTCHEVQSAGRGCAEWVRLQSIWCTVLPFTINATNNKEGRGSRDDAALFKLKVTVLKGAVCKI